jgi:hypothetical protein
MPPSVFREPPLFFLAFEPRILLVGASDCACLSTARATERPPMSREPFPYGGVEVGSE